MDDIWNNFFLKGGTTRGQIVRKQLEENEEILRNEIKNYTIDSCWTFDEGYETAIWHNDYGNIIIVERYKTKEDMQKGHKKWMKFCEKNPKEVYSVQLNKIENLRLINND